jgi:hypothetical protein
VRLDLHCHSTRSDGTLEPEQVARRAAEYGVELFCLTDHDTMAGYEQTRVVLTDAVVLRGLELSCKHHGRTVHLLLYGVTDGPGLVALQHRLDEVNADRSERIKKIVHRLGELGIELDEASVLARTRGRTPGRPHVAQALLDAGVVTSLREAFDRFLRDGGPADVEIDRVSLEDGLALGRAAGAKMSLAHPHTSREPAIVAEMYRELRDHGLEGIEAWYGSYAVAQRRGWLRLAAEQDLVVTAGSDFHGGVLPEIARPGIELPDPHAARLREWLGIGSSSG